jgi:hypothetical protein
MEMGCEKSRSLMDMTALFEDENAGSNPAVK